jgi:hypothetical protein
MANSVTLPDGRIYDFPTEEAANAFRTKLEPGSVTLPDGRIYDFPTQFQADSFRKKYNLPFPEVEQKEPEPKAAPVVTEAEEVEYIVPEPPGLDAVTTAEPVAETPPVEETVAEAPPVEDVQQEEVQFIDTPLADDEFSANNLTDRDKLELKRAIARATDEAGEPLYTDVDKTLTKVLADWDTRSFEERQKVITELRSFDAASRVADDFSGLTVDQTQGEAVEAPVQEPVAPVDLGRGEIISKGFDVGVEGIKNIPTALRSIFNATDTERRQGLLAVYDRLDAGEPIEQIFPRDRFTQSVSALETRAQAYLRGTPEEREALRKAEIDNIDINQKTMQELLPVFLEFQTRMQANAEGIPDFTDIKDYSDFEDWLLFHGTAGTVQLLPLMLAALTTGGLGTFALGSAYGLQEGVGDRLNFILKSVENLSEEDKAKAVSKYLAETADVTFAQAIISGQLDKMGGPVRRILQSASVKKAADDVAKESLGQAAAKETAVQVTKRTAKELGQDVLGEFATGAGQSVTQLVAELQLGEKAGPVFTAENMKQIINDAAAEAAGVPGAKAIQGAGATGINVAKKKAESRRQKKFLEDPRVPTVVREYMETRMGQGITFGQAYEEVQEHVLGNDNPVKDQPVTGEDLANAAKVEDARSQKYIKYTFDLLDIYDEYDAQQIADRADDLIDKGKSAEEAFNQAEEEHKRMNREQLELQDEADLQMGILEDYDSQDADTIVYRATSLIEQGTPQADAYARARKEFDKGELEMPDVVRYRTPDPLKRPGDVDLADIATAETEATVAQDRQTIADAQRQNPYQTTEDLLNVDINADTDAQVAGIQADLNLAKNDQETTSAVDRAAVLAEELLAQNPDELAKLRKGEQVTDSLAVQLQNILNSVPPAKRNQSFNRAKKEIKRVNLARKKNLSTVDPADRATNLIDYTSVAAINRTLLSQGEPIEGAGDPARARLLNIAASVPTTKNNPEYQAHRLKLLTHLALMSRSPALNGTTAQKLARSTLKDYDVNPKRAQEVAIAKERAKKLKPYGKQGEARVSTDPIADVANYVNIPLGEVGPQRMPAVTRKKKPREVVGPPRFPVVARKPKSKDPKLVGDYEPTLTLPPSNFVGPPSRSSLQHLENLLAMSDEDKQTIDKDAEQINELLSEVQLTPAEARELGRAMGDYFKKTRGREYNLGTLLRDINEITGEKFVYLIQALQTSDLSRIFKRLTRGVLGPDDPDHFKVLQNTMDEMGGERNQYIENSKPLIEMWREFNQKFKRGARVLAELMNESTIVGIDPSKRKTVDNAIRADKQLKDLRAKLKEEGANKNKIEKQISARKSNIRKVYSKWDELGKIDGGTGRRIYTQARDKYKQYFDDYEQLLVKTIQDSGLNEADKIAQISKIQEQFNIARERVPVYFPLKRFGEFWIRVSNSGDANMDGFYMFESTREARQALDEIKQNISDADVALADVVITEGNAKTRPPREELAQSDSLLKDIFKAIDGKSNEAGLNINALKDQITQMYLATLPGQSLRTMFLNRKGTAGASQDVLRSYASTVSSVATQLPRLKYGDVARRELSALKDQVAEFPNRAKLDALIGEVEDRVNMELTPPIPSFWDTLATYGNKATFLWLMSAAKSGLLQTTQFPLVVGPVLLQEFRNDVGKAKTIAKFMQYLNVFNKMGVANSIKTWTKPTIMNSGYINNHKDKALLKRAWDTADALGKFNTTYAADVGDLSNAPSEKSRFRKGTAATYNFMTGFFHHAERITRELAYMSGFELAHEQALKKGLKGEEAFRYATQKALDVMNEGLFDYSQYNKPSVLRKNAGTKSAFQFMSFSNMMASLMVRNFANMVKPMDPKDRRDAAVLFFGVNLQAALFAGIGGFWGANFVWSAAQMAFDMYGDIVRSMEAPEDETDEEYKARVAREWMSGNPAYYVTAKDWLNKWMIPTYVGVEGTIPSYLGIENTRRAKFMQLVLEKGLISTVLDIDMSNSLSLDGLLLRDRPRDPEANFFENAVDQAANIGFFPVLSVLKDVGRGVADIVNGEYARGVERIVPAIIKGQVRAYRRGTEGLVTYDGTKLSQIDYSGFELFVMALTGGRNLEEARITDNAYSMNKFYSDVRKARADVFSRARNDTVKWKEGELDLATLNSSLNDVDEWNKKYPGLDPTTFKVIEYGNLLEAADAEQMRRDLTAKYYGVRRPEDAAQNMRLLYLLEKYIGIVPDEAAIKHNTDILDKYYNDNIQGK